MVNSTFLQKKFGRSTYVLNYQLKSANFWYSKSIFYVKNYPNLSKKIFNKEYQFRGIFFVSDMFWKLQFLKLFITKIKTNFWCRSCIKNLKWYVCIILNQSFSCGHGQILDLLFVIFDYWKIALHNLAKTLMNSNSYLQCLPYACQPNLLLNTKHI